MDRPDDSAETELMRRLGELVHQPAAFRFLEGMTCVLRQQLDESREVKSTHAAVPLEIYGAAVPPEVRSSWVFVLRAGFTHPAERHPNSIQRMFALDSPGAMEVWQDGGWHHCPFERGADQPGLSIPAFAWHRPGRLDDIWAVVSFHSVEAHELIEEVGDPASNSISSSRHYIPA